MLRFSSAIVIALPRPEKGKGIMMRRFQIFLFKLRQTYLKPRAEGFLPCVDGHQIHYMDIGNPDGRPVLFFHGGPGGGAKAKNASIFNLKTHRVLLFDQRGCGQSTAEDPFYKNTSQDTLQDALHLLDYLGIQEKITVSGGSFGATLALLFAETYPDRVERIFVNSVFLGRSQDSACLSPVVPLFYADYWEQLEKMAAPQTPAAYFYNLIFSKDVKDQEKALRYYRGLEYAIGSKEVTFSPVEVTPQAVLSHRIFLHYDRNQYFLKDNQLLQNADKIRHIPTVILHNRLDMCCPVSQAYELAKALPKADFRIIPSYGHGSLSLFFTAYQINRQRES